MRGLDLYHFVAEMHANIHQSRGCLARLFCCDTPCKRRKFLGHLELRLEKCNATKPTMKQLKSIRQYIHSHRAQFSAWGVTERYKTSYLDAMYEVLTAPELFSQLNWTQSINQFHLDRWQMVGAIKLKTDMPIGFDDCCDRKGLLILDDASDSDVFVDSSDSDPEGYHRMESP